MAPLRRCLGCGSPTRNGSRCRSCQLAHKAVRNADAPAAAAAVDAHRAALGDWCPGYGRPGHHATDLTAEHSTPISRGGVVDGVLCRSCNSRKRDR